MLPSRPRDEVSLTGQVRILGKSIVTTFLPEALA